MRILLVEDDELLGDGVRAGLVQKGYTVDWIKDGQSALQALSSDFFDIVVLDLGLPRRSGLDVLTTFRRQQSHQKSETTPVIILTARETVDDRVKGLDAGADDYMIKPFDLNELLARIRSLQRRKNARAENLLTFGAVTLDPTSHIVTKNGKPISLSRREFALIQKFLENSERVLSRDQLTQSLYGWGDDVDSNALEVHIHNLRKKFGTSFIRTIRGVGYMVGQ